MVDLETFDLPFRREPSEMSEFARTEQARSYERARHRLNSDFVQLGRVLTSPEMEAAFKRCADLVELLLSDINQFYIDTGQWEYVDPRDISTPEQRWEYQKWVLNAPLRWLKKLIDLGGRKEARKLERVYK